MSRGSGADAFLANKSATEPNYQLANELYRQIIRKFKRGKVYSSFRDNVLGIDLVDMQSLSKHKGIKYLLCAIDLFSKYAWVVFLKDKRGITIINTFQKIISKGGEAESKGRCKPNKIWVHQGDEFYNKIFKRFLKINNIEMYSTYSEGKSAFADDSHFKNSLFWCVLIKTILLINTITVHRTTKMKRIDVTSNSYVEYNEDS